MQLPCLPTCNYGNGSVSWTVNVSYNRPASQIDIQRNMVGFVMEGHIKHLLGPIRFQYLLQLGYKYPYMPPTVPSILPGLL